MIRLLAFRIVTLVGMVGLLMGLAYFPVTLHYLLVILVYGLCLPAIWPVGDYFLGVHRG